MPRESWEKLKLINNDYSLYWIYSIYMSFIVVFEISFIQKNKSYYEQKYSHLEHLKVSYLSLLIPLFLLTIKIHVQSIQKRYSTSKHQHKFTVSAYSKVYSSLLSISNTQSAKYCSFPWHQSAYPASFLYPKQQYSLITNLSLQHFFWFPTSLIVIFPKIPIVFLEIP